MRIVYRAENLVDAHLVKDALEREGIPALVSGEYLIGGQLPARDFLAVMVPEAALPRARRCVREVEAMLAAPLAGEPGAEAAGTDEVSGIMLPV